MADRKDWKALYLEEWIRIPHLHMMAIQNPVIARRGRFIVYQFLSNTKNETLVLTTN